MRFLGSQQAKHDRCRQISHITITAQHVQSKRFRQHNISRRTRSLATEHPTSPRPFPRKHLPRVSGRAIGEMRVLRLLNTPIYHACHRQKRTLQLWCRVSFQASLLSHCSTASPSSLPLSLKRLLRVCFIGTEVVVILRGRSHALVMS